MLEAEKCIVKGPVSWGNRNLRFITSGSEVQEAWESHLASETLWGVTLLPGNVTL